MMHRLGCYIFCIVFGGFAFVVRAANMDFYLVDEHSLYSTTANRSPFFEQFTTIVNSPPVPIRLIQTSPVHIAVMLFGKIDSIDNQALLLSLRRRMRELNIDYRLATYIDRSEYGGDPTPYLKMEVDQPDYIVMTKFGSMQRRYLERFLHSGKSKVILYDFASQLIPWMRYPPLMYIGFDQKQATKRLASYLDRQLPMGASLSALVLPESYLGHVRCDLFLDEMFRFGRRINTIKVVSDNKKEAFHAAKILLEDATTSFIFSCTQSISDGVVAALQEKNRVPITQTNAWGISSNGLFDLKSKKVKVSMFFMKDDLSIAVAEAIKLDLEGKAMPNLYIANSTLVPENLDSESLALMLDKAYQYSAILWQK